MLETNNTPNTESPSVVSEWPSLGDTMTVKSKEPFPIETKKKLPRIKANQPKSSLLTPTLAAAKSITTPTGPAWGGIGISKETPRPESATSFSLLDVMNEEMKKLKVSTPSVKQMPKKTPIPPVSVPTRSGWNLPASQSVPTQICSIANIMEMETKSKNQYRKLKMRPLNIIQMEEAAIERLQKYYDVDNVFDMTIKIELIDEVDFKDCAPIWNTKK